VTDLAVWKPDPHTKAFQVVSIHPAATRARVEETCGWPVHYAPGCMQTPPPTQTELDTLRALMARTEAAHKRRVAG
jgi:glutaconate CoA-transferase subunit B